MQLFAVESILGWRLSIEFMRVNKLLFHMYIEFSGQVR